VLFPIKSIEPTTALAAGWSILTINVLPPLRIRELPPSERPLARLQQHGPQALSDAELLALVLQAESLDLAQRLLVDLAAGRASSAPPSPRARSIWKPLIGRSSRSSLLVRRHDSDSRSATCASS